METIATLFLWCLMVVIGLLPAFYEYEKALYKSYQEVRKQYSIEEDYLLVDEKLSFSEWASLMEVHDASYRNFCSSRLWGGNPFFF